MSLRIHFHIIYTCIAAIINCSSYQTEEPKEAIIKLKSMAFEMAKNYGFEIDEQMEWPEIKKKVMETMRENGVPVGK